MFDTLELTASAFSHSDNPAKIVPELIENAGMQVIMQVLQIVGSSNPITFVVAQVIQIATWAVGIARAVIEDDLAKQATFPPLQTEDPATDTWQVTRVFEVFRARGSGGVVFPDGKIEPASNADYTSLYLPAYRTHMRWQLQHRNQGVAAQHGYGSDGGEGSDVRFDPGEASNFGFMPGTTVMLRVQLPRGGPRPQARVVDAAAQAKTRKKAAIVAGVTGGIVAVTAATIVALHANAPSPRSAARLDRHFGLSRSRSQRRPGHVRGPLQRGQPDAVQLPDRPERT